MAHESGWTMDLFIEWAFGPARVFDAVRLLEQAQRLAAALRVNPADLRARKRLRRRLRALRDIADGRQWRREGDLAAALMALRGAPEETTLILDQLQNGLRFLEGAVRARLASTIKLSLPAMDSEIQLQLVAA